MEVFVNERKVKVNSEIGRWGSLIGIVVLLGGMFVSFKNPDLVWVSMTSLVVGFFASVIGAYYANHWTRHPRADEVLDRALKGVSGKYHMYHYLLPLPHVLLGPAGLFVFRVYLHEGKVTFDGKKWRQKQSWLHFFGFTGQEALADPVKDTLYDVERFRRWLSKRLPEDKIPPIIPFIVFARDNVHLEMAAETEVPVLRPRQLKKRVRQIDRECRHPLDEDALYEIEQAMLGDRIEEL